MCNEEINGPNRSESPQGGGSATKSQKYHDRFPPNRDEKCESKAKRALETALDIRKFEIELYWKRAAYFWVFTGAALAGYLTALTGNEVQNRSLALLLTSCIGLVFAIAWYFVNRASKYWQLNWEFHVDALEDTETGPLYKTVLEEKSVKFWRLQGSYPFSVSKINQWLSLFVAVLFAALLCNTAFSYYGFDLHGEILPAACIVGTIVAVFVLYKWGRVSSYNASARPKYRTTEILEEKGPR